MLICEIAILYWFKQQYLDFVTQLNQRTKAASTGQHNLETVA